MNDVDQTGLSQKLQESSLSAEKIVDVMLSLFKRPTSVSYLANRFSLTRSQLDGLAAAGLLLFSYSKESRTLVRASKETVEIIKMQRSLK